PVDFDGSEVDFLAGHKGMPADQVGQLLERVTGIASSVGLDYDFDILKHTNTVKAHELLHYAKAQGKQLEMAERLFLAYFTEGRHIGRVADLADLAASIGLDRAAVVAALESEQYLSDVRADQGHAQEYGIQGVPFFVIEGRYGVSGAQDPATFAQVLEQVWAERAEVPA
ncbi:MAG: DsbA family oxidoreductase, partial [Leifsonia sp.]